MRQGDSTVLDNLATPIADAHELIVNMARGRRVLNVGAAGNAAYYRDHGTDGWLHARLGPLAETLVGLDLDGDEVKAAAGLGFDIQVGNCETANLNDTFDLIVLADVLEHVDNPALAMANMMRHLKPGGKIVLTTPNATFFGNVANALLRRGPNVYWDHVNLYTLENIQALCDRHEFVLAERFLGRHAAGGRTVKGVHQRVVRRHHVPMVYGIAQGLGMNGAHVPVDQARAVQFRQNTHDAAGAVHVFHMEQLGRRGHLGQVGDLAAQPVDIVHGEINAAFVGDG